MDKSTYTIHTKNGYDISTTGLTASDITQYLTTAKLYTISIWKLISLELKPKHILSIIRNNKHIVVLNIYDSEKYISQHQLMDSIIDNPSIKFILYTPRSKDNSYAYISKQQNIINNILAHDILKKYVNEPYSYLLYEKGLYMDDITVEKITYYKYIGTENIDYEIEYVHDILDIGYMFDISSLSRSFYIFDSNIVEWGLTYFPIKKIDLQSLEDFKAINNIDIDIDKIISNTSIKTIKLYSLYDVSLVDVILTNGNIENLNIDIEQHINNNPYQKLFMGLHHSNITNLIVNITDGNDEDVKSIAHALSHPLCHLTHVVVIDNKTGNNHMDVVFDALAINTSLTDVRVAYYDYDNNGNRLPIGDESQGNMHLIRFIKQTSASSVTLGIDNITNIRAISNSILPNNITSIFFSKRFYLLDNLSVILQLLRNNPSLIKFGILLSTLTQDPQNSAPDIIDILTQRPYLSIYLNYYLVAPEMVPITSQITEISNRNAHYMSEMNTSLMLKLLQAIA